MKNGGAIAKMGGGRRGGGDSGVGRLEKAKVIKGNGLKPIMG